jgi:hypothetical protein
MSDRESPKRETLVLDADQLVGYNLSLARRLRRWTQEEAAEHLEPYLGARWSKATFSVAERSFQGGRRKRFTASEIIAFAQGFSLPVAWFFMPPYPEDADSVQGKPYQTVPVVTREPLARGTGREQQPWDLLPGNLIDLLFGMDFDELDRRLAATIAALPPDLQAEIQRSTGEYIAGIAGTVAGVHLSEFAGYRDVLRRLADALDRVVRETPEAAIAAAHEPNERGDDEAGDRPRGGQR